MPGKKDLCDCPFRVSQSFAVFVVAVVKGVAIIFV